jgi:hypothetical protein
MSDIPIDYISQIVNQIIGCRFNHYMVYREKIDFLQKFANDHNVTAVEVVRRVFHERPNNIHAKVYQSHLISDFINKYATPEELVECKKILCEAPKTPYNDDVAGWIAHEKTAIMTFKQ